MAMFRIYLYTNKVGSEVETEVEIDDEELEDMAEGELDELMKEMMLDASLFEWGYERLND